MKINMEKLSQQAIKAEIPNTENARNPNGFFGYFEEREGYNKLVAYGPYDTESKFSWVHKEYQL
jgi:hypothetical protein